MWDGYAPPDHYMYGYPPPHPMGYPGYPPPNYMMYPPHYYDHGGNRSRDEIDDLEKHSVIIDNKK